MNDTISRLEAWGDKWARAILWCQTHLEKDTWRYLGDRIEIDNDKDYTMFMLSNEL